MKINKKDKEYSILIVEDEPEIAELVIEAMKMEKLFTKIIHASDGNEALYKVGNQDFDLIITDIKMPKIDGVSMIELLKKHRKFKEISFLIISGSITEGVAKKILELGTQHILVKPFSMEEIIVKSKEILGIT